MPVTTPTLLAEIMEVSMIPPVRPVPEMLPTLPDVLTKVALAIAVPKMEVAEISPIEGRIKVRPSIAPPVPPAP